MEHHGSERRGRREKVQACDDSGGENEPTKQMEAAASELTKPGECGARKPEEERFQGGGSEPLAKCTPGKRRIKTDPWIWQPASLWLWEM